MTKVIGTAGDFDERSRGVDSVAPSGDFRIEIGRLSYGTISPGGDEDDWYEVKLAGAGSYCIVFSVDPANSDGGPGWIHGEDGFNLTAVVLWDHAEDPMQRRYWSQASNVWSDDAVIAFVWDGSAPAPPRFLSLDGPLRGVDYVVTLEHTPLRAQGAVLLGSDGSDTLIGGAGNDTFRGGPGADFLFGHPFGRAATHSDVDLVEYDTPRANFEISLLPPSQAWLVRRRDREFDRDNLFDIERITFADRGLALDVGADGHAGQTARILHALFGPGFVARPEWVSTGLRLLDAGMPFESLVALAVGSDVFAQLAGSHSNRDFVAHVLRNLTGIAPAGADVDHYSGLLDAGAATQASLALLACLHPATTQSAELIGVAQTGIEFALGG